MAASLNRFLSLTAAGWCSGHAADHTASPVILPGCGAGERAVLASRAWPGKGVGGAIAAGALAGGVARLVARQDTSPPHSRMNTFCGAGARAPVARRKDGLPAVHGPFRGQGGRPPRASRQGVAGAGPPDRL